MTKTLPASIMDKLAQVALVVSDVDGMLSRRIRLDHEGEETKVFCEKDAPRVAAIVKAGIPFVMISGRDSPAAARRAHEMKATFYCRKHLVHEKDAFAFIERAYEVPRSRTLYMGDDWQDLWWFKQALVSATPSDAVEECLRHADIVTESRGGEGAVSEVLLHLLRAKGLLEKIVAAHLNEAPRYT